MAGKIDEILKRYTDLTDPAGDKLLFAAFVVVDKDGESNSQSLLSS